MLDALSKLSVVESLLNAAQKDASREARNAPGADAGSDASSPPNGWQLWNLAAPKGKRRAFPTRAANITKHGYRITREPYIMSLGSSSHSPPGQLVV